MKVGLSPSIGRKFALVMVFTVGVVGVAGFFAGASIVNQLTGMIDDTAAMDALDTGREALVSLRKLRRAHTERQIKDCLSRGAWPACPQEDGAFRIKETSLQPPTPEFEWLSETELVVGSGGASALLVFDWPLLKPKFDAMSESLATHSHLREIMPGLTESFYLVFAGALVIASLLGLCVTFLLSRRLTVRARQLTEYTRRIAQGHVAEAPVSTLGHDEIGLLAEALQTMAFDLEATRHRLLLTEKMSSWQNVARKVAHEIKNPLTPISLVASEMQRMSLNERESPALRSFLGESGRILAEETASLSRMVKEFTAFARLPSPDLQPGDLGEITADFVARNGASPLIRFALAAGAPALPCVVDRGMIMQILHNLTNNARLAKEPAVVLITISLCAGDELVELRFQDDGPGVPEALRSSLFDAYVTSRSTGDGEKGMGLGLTISHKIAHDHGGSLTLETTGSHGTVFKLTLPRHPQILQEVSES